MNDARHSMDVAEAARETEWSNPSFAANLFMGEWAPSLIFPYPLQSEEDRKAGDEYMRTMDEYLRKNLNPERADEEKALPKGFLDGLAKMGAFGLKIPKEYGGMQMSQTNYGRVMSHISSYDASTAVWLSAHQSIGVPTPLKMFGTPEQKKKYLPELAAGKISAFALTEPGVGSDPARLSTEAKPSDDGKGWILNGTKLWCTNGPSADIIVVMAKTPPKIVKGREKTQISAFILPMNQPGIRTVHRCDFMGLKSISNGLLEFKDVYIPNEDLLGKTGEGLKLALATLNTGRLTLPAACVGGAKQALRYARIWANKREQWGAPVSQHEAVAEKLANMASGLFAMEAVTWLATALVDRGGYDIRIEAAIAKLFGSEVGYRIIDDALQIRGGRGFETASSLKARGEEPWPVERMYRDNRINTIIEGSSEIMYLFLAREALDPHFKKAGALTDPRSAMGEKVSSAIKAGLHYALWYPKQWLPTWLFADTHMVHPELRGHARWVARKARKLSRAIFHAMALNGPKLEKKQITMTRLVGIGVELYVMTACMARATRLVESNASDRTSLQMADHYCRRARRKVRGLFSDILCHHDRSTNALAKAVREGRVEWVEQGIVTGDPEI
ncbi:MAG: acyl-CoA dehydrogenase family protein [Planctomycetota bacterium]